LTLSHIRPTPCPTLFPYTTLFRSLHNYFAGSSDQKRLLTAIQIFDQLHAGIATVKDQQQTHVRWGGLRQPGEQVAFDGVLRRRRSEEHTSELQSRFDLVCRLLLEK